MGLAVNQPVEGLTLPHLLEKLEIASEIKAPPDLVLLGGPMERERGFVLHTKDYAAETTLDVGPGLSLTGTRDVLEAVAEARGRPRRSCLALGYAGWSAGQLEDEIKENVWLTCEPDETLIFDLDHDAKWRRALAKLGVDPEHLGAAAGHA